MLWQHSVYSLLATKYQGYAPFVFSKPGPLTPISLVIKKLLHCSTCPYKTVQLVAYTCTFSFGIFWSNETEQMLQIRPFWKAAAIFVRGQIWDGPTPKNDHQGLFSLHTKFHACIIQTTIFPKFSLIHCIYENLKAWEKDLHTISPPPPNWP